MNLLRNKLFAIYGVGALPHGKGGSSSAPAPDPAIGQAELEDANLEQQELSNYENVYEPAEISAQNQANSIDQSEATADNALASAQTSMVNNENSEYTNEYEPLMNQMVNQASNYDTQANYNQMAQQAVGDVNNTDAAAQQSQAMEMESVGVNPTSGAFQGMWNADNINNAAQGAAAASRALTGAQQLGWNMEDQAAAMGQALPSDASQATSTATNADNSASSSANSELANTTTSANLNNSSIGDAANIETSMGNLGVGTYQTQVNAWNAQQQAQAQSSAGIGSALGGVAMAGAMMMM